MQLQFNAATVAPAEPGLPVWDGPVLVMIKRTEVQNTAANNGNKMLILHVNALDGAYRGQDQVIRLNLWNSNAQASDIAQRQLSSICHVTGRMQIQDSDQLIGVPFVAVYAKEDREITDQQTNAKRTVEGCQAKDFRMADGRTIREVMNGQPASSPYVPATVTAGAHAPQGGAPGGAPQSFPQAGGPAPGGGAPQFGPQGGGFAGPQAGPQGGPQGGFAPAGAFPMPGAAPGAAPQGGPQPGFQQPQGGQGQFGGAPGMQQPQGQGFAPQGQNGPGALGAGPAMGQHGGPQPGPQGFGTAASGFNPSGAPQGFGGAPQGGQQFQQQPQGQFQPPGGPQAGPGPWGGGQPQQ